jgi:hypothetical protein
MFGVRGMGSLPLSLLEVDVVDVALDNNLKMRRSLSRPTFFSASLFCQWCKDVAESRCHPYLWWWCAVSP